MSAVVHHSDAFGTTIPKRFTCGRKCKGGNEWTRVADFVECPQCLAKLKERVSNAALGEHFKGEMSMFVEHKEVGEVVESPAKITKLSQAIRRGCEVSAPTKEINAKAWVTWRSERCFSCVIGAAWLGFSGGNQCEYRAHGSTRREVADKYGAAIDLLDEAQDRYEELGHSREQIADWLEAQGF